MARYVKHVRLRMTEEQRSYYRRTRPQGITIIWYPRHSFDLIDATFIGNSETPTLLEQRDKNDLDTELSRIGKHVVKDNLTEKDNPKLVKDPLVKVEALISHPGLNGQNDYLRSKATNVHDVHIYESKLKQLEQEFEKKSFVYAGLADKTKLRHIIRSYRDPFTSEKIHVMKMGQVEGNDPKDINRNPSNNPVTFEEWKPSRLVRPYRSQDVIKEFEPEKKKTEKQE